ncbi:MAG TPA: hypothetical protein VFR76_01825 [Verrucomicrobiae bacterium]|nr:hypothetical protein [Verrucomicrobiae bacterium]
MARWHSCNVLRTGADARQLWQFDARDGGFALNREYAPRVDEPLPASLVGKSWRSLWQPALNVAWLPPQSVFLRAVHLPQATFEETLSMVELQMEKLSPIPVTQAVWSIQVLPRALGVPRENGKEAGDLQTVIVVIAERKAVEDFLGQLEGEGFQANRLELSTLDQLRPPADNENGAWIYPGALGSHGTALVAWWYGGVLQTLNFIALPDTGDSAVGLHEQLAQMVWAGEMEGWLSSQPVWHLVVDPATTDKWEAPLRQAVEAPVIITPSLDAAKIAALTAKRAVEANGKANLLPPEFTTRYRQQFVDQLWMRSLGAIGAVYAVGVAIYFAALSFQLYRVNRVESEVKGLSQTYTNAVQLKARYQVLQDRQDLKFAALDCWKTVAELLPETVTLEAFNLGDGRKLLLSGSAPTSEMRAVVDFVQAMRKATINGQPMFDQTKPEQFSSRPTQVATTTSWSFSLELKRGEAR